MTTNPTLTEVPQENREAIERGVAASFEFWEAINDDPNRFNRADQPEQYRQCDGHIVRAMAHGLLTAEMTDDGGIAIIMEATRSITAPAGGTIRRQAYRRALGFLSVEPAASQRDLELARVFGREHSETAKKSIFSLAKLMTYGYTPFIPKTE